MSCKVALVTGASRGIGKEISVRLARAGYCLALLGRKEDLLAETAAACKTASACEETESARKRARTEQQILTFSVDLRKREEVEKAVEDTVAAFGGISVLVCNAGVLISASAVTGNPESWEEELDVNVKGTMAASRAALPHIIKSPHTRAVIIIGSTGSRWSWPYGGGYCASKHALRGYAGSLFEEVRDKGVKVCIIMPGFTDTDMTAANKGMVREKMIRPDDVAHAVECVLNFPSSACPTEILIRPQYSCVDGSVPYTIV
eukprot:TRINITY_DN78410_c0_g1_i1.p1 TRINITY_DN78410_c0_g1~~TRINITY_DN78410_c0_g1_i1.p1  ORF type:complete len:261 (+),score=43.10 TRINITY_DN78410_c0_g1_i1:58-840(+)